MKPSNQSLCVLSLALTVICACSAPPRVHSELEDISARHTSELARLEEAQADFEQRYPMPQQINLGPEGTLLIHEASLEGPLGDEELRLLYTYVNTTGGTIDAAAITLTLSDPEVDLERSARTELRLPFLFRFGPDSCYTTHLYVPLRGMYLSPSWQWKLNAQAIVRHAQD